MIRILHSVSNMDRAGIETMLMNYYRYMDKSKVQFDFLCNKKKTGAYDDEIKSMGGRIYHTPGLNPAKYPVYLKYMRELFQEHPEYKIVEAHNGALGVYALHAAKVSKIPVRIFHAHGASITKDWKLPIKLVCKACLPTNMTHHFSCGVEAAKCYFGQIMSSIVLFDDKKDCCGCGACMNVCPKNAIRMAEDEVGFVYPEIDQNLCIGCGACKKACGYQMQPMMQKSEAVYAAASNDDNLLRKSASGGAFAVLAENVLKKGGVVYGAALPLESGKLEPKHLRIDTVERLPELQGSKYVQSAIGDTYAQAKKDLLDGKSVLFSGTPCQIAGLKQYLKKDYENLLTVDIICHGVPSKRFFQSFMEDYGKKLGGTITEFYFRDKSKGQGMITRSVYKDMTGENKEKVLIGGLTAYIHFFSKSYIYRKNCYSCPFASEKRVGDLTLGDFWGFHEEYPSYDEKQGLSNGKGVSCILVNTNQGKATLEQCEGQFVLMTSDFEKVARHNDQLHSPSKYSPKREQILELYQKEGYEAVDRYFHKNYKKDILKYTVSGMLPKGLKRNIKKMAGKIKNK